MPHLLSRVYKGNCLSFLLNASAFLRLCVVVAALILLHVSSGTRLVDALVSVRFAWFAMLTGVLLRQWVLYMENNLPKVHFTLLILV